MVKYANRCYAYTRKIHHGSHSFIVTFGRCPSTLKLMEVFYSDGMRVGTDLQHSVTDACIIISLLLHRDVPIEEIKSLSALHGRASLLALWA